MSTDLQFSHKLDYSAVQYASQRDLIMLASITGQTGGDRQRAPLDLVAVLDRCDCHRRHFHMCKTFLVALFGQGITFVSSVVQQVWQHGWRKTKRGERDREIFGAADVCSGSTEHRHILKRCETSTFTCLVFLAKLLEV